MKSIQALRTILNTATAELGSDHDQVVMLRSLLEAKLNEHGASIDNKTVITTGPARIIDEQRQ